MRKGGKEMKILQNLFTKGGTVVGSPAAGRLVSIKEVSDPTFADEILGKGAAVIPSADQIYAPIDGKVTTVFPTGHAVAVTGHDGTEVLIHVGLDTVKLNGEHFTIRVEADQEVKKGDLLLEADLEQIKAAGYDIITPIVICNSDDFAEVQAEASREVSPGDDILRLRK